MFCIFYRAVVRIVTENRAYSSSLIIRRRRPNRMTPSACYYVFTFGRNGTPDIVYASKIITELSVSSRTERVFYFARSSGRFLRYFPPPPEEFKFNSRFSLDPSSFPNGSAYRDISTRRTNIRGRKFPQSLFWTQNSSKF